MVDHDLHGLGKNWDILAHVFHSCTAEFGTVYGFLEDPIIFSGSPCGFVPRWMSIMEFWIGMVKWGFGDSCIILMGVAFFVLGCFRFYPFV
jgi:hypothetical protein